jgi:(2Fe-2S) ferredoxin
MTKSEIVNALSKVCTARRGQITEQWYTVKLKDGTEHKQGPYYVWTYYDRGVKHTKRVKANDVQRVKQELAAGKEVEQLISAYWSEVESNTQNEEKKTTANSNLVSAKKSMRRIHKQRTRFTKD